jgi:xylulokinase
MSEFQGVLVVDIGTETVRSALIDREGKILALAGRNPSFSSPRPSWAEQSPREWWELSVACIRGLLERFPDFEVLAIGVSAQMHAVCPVDSRGNLLMDLVPIWCDKRSLSVCKRIASLLNPEEQIEKTANLIIPNWIGPKVAWIKENLPEVYERAAYFLTAKDYLNYLLTGEIATDFSEASGTFLFSWEKKTWDDDLFELFELDKKKFPQIIPSFKVIGTTKEDINKLLGLKNSVPVICGAGDMLCLLLGGGMFEEGRSCDVGGTASDVSVFTPSPLLSQKLMNLHHAIPGWISFGILDSGGGSVRWLRDALYKLGNNGGAVSYQLIDEEAAQVPPGAEGLMFFPYLLGERLLGSPNARGVFLGILPHHRRAHFARAVLEGVCFDLKMSLDEIERLFPGEISEMSCIGGGARSDLWSQIKADIYQKEVFTLVESEGGILGAGILAFSGFSGVAPQEIARVWVKEKKRFYPSGAKKYEKAYKHFKEMHDLLQPVFERMGEEVS